jgi:hypothetical protein
MTRGSTAAAVAAAVLAGGALLAGAPAARADSVTVTPASALLYTFTGFTASGTVTEPIDSNNDGFVLVALDGVTLGDAREDLDTGAFTGTFQLSQPEGPAVTPVCGTNTVTVTTETDGGTGFLVGSATINLACASISVTPSVAGNQQLPATFGVTPENYPLPGGFTLTVDGVPQAFTGSGAGLQFTATPSCGSHQVALGQVFNGQVVSAAAQLTVLCPQITLTPPAIGLASQPTAVQVTGSQFHPGQPVTISLDGNPAGQATTGEAGGLSTSITAQGLGCAAHDVTVREQPADGGPAFLLSASAPLQVTGCKRTLAVDPAVLQPGEFTKVTGSGFAPGKTVTLTWQLPGGTPLLGSMTVTAGADGGISAFFMVATHDLLGARQLAATQGSFRLTAGAVVDGGPMQPASGGHLVYRR